MKHFPARQRAAIALSVWTLALWLVLVADTGNLFVATFCALVAGALTAAIARGLTTVVADLWHRVWLVVGTNPFRSPQRCLELASSRLFTSTSIIALGGRRLPHATVRVVLADADLEELLVILPRDMVDRELTKQYRSQVNHNPTGLALTAHVDSDFLVPRGRFRVEPVTCPVAATHRTNNPSGASARTEILGRHRHSVLASSTPVARKIVGTDAVVLPRTRVLTDTPASPRLTFSMQGTTWTVNTESIIGRAGHAEIRLDDPFMSAEHASVYRTGTTWVLRDLESTNGMYVNGQRVQDVVLTPRTRVQFGRRTGSTELVVENISG